MRSATVTRFGTTASGTTSSTGEKTYPYYLGTDEYLGVPIINAGVGGDNTNHAMARFKTDVLDKNPDVTIICLGMNDQAMVISSGNPNISLATYKSNLDYFAKSLKESGSDVVFVTPSKVNTNSGYYVPGAYGLDYGSELMDVFCNAIREVAMDNDCGYVDINRECDFEDMNKFAQVGDGIHHSDYGRRQYAKYISDYLLAAYDGKNKAEMTIKCVDEKGNLLLTKKLVGAEGAHVTIASPEIPGYSVKEGDVKATYSDGEVYTFNYSYDIYGAIADAENLLACDYGNEIIDLIRESVSEAKSLVESNADASELIKCSQNIRALIAAAGGNPYIVSTGASYTTTAPNRNTLHDDDGIRLTDGEKDSPDGSTARYSGWDSTTAVNIDVDLGEVKAVNSFSAYCASDGGWGIKKPAKLTVYISENGTDWEEIASQTNLKTTFNLTNKKGNWDTTVITAVSDKIHSTRYVRFSVTPNGNFVWLSEVEAALRSVPEKSLVYVTGINEKLTEGGSVIYTNATNPATNVPNDQSIISVVAAKNDRGYVVSSVTEGKGVPEISLAVNEILIALYSDGSANAKRALSLKAGDAFLIDGVDFENATTDIMPYISIVDYKGEPELKDGKTFWVTHFNDNSSEGAGSIFTQEYTGCGWWVHAAFKPVEGLENVYELVEKSDGASNGTATPLAIPEGGFVYAVNTGNDWITLNNDEHNVNFKNAGANASLSAIRSMRIGDKVQFSGLNLDTLRIPTTTEYIDYYSEGYICTAQYAKYVEENSGNNQVAVKVSHVNLYNWQTFESMIISGDGKTVANVIGHNISKDWVVYTVEKQNGKYIATKCYENSNECHTVTVPNGGFLYCVYKNNSAYELAKDGGLLGAEFELDGLGVSASDKLAIDTNVSSPTFIYLTIPEKPEPTGILGDVNNDGKIDQYDYVLVKRHHFNTRTLTEDEATRADANKDGKVDQYDYLLIARHYFGTYVIK